MSTKDRFFYLISGHLDITNLLSNASNNTPGEGGQFIFSQPYFASGD